MGRTESFDKMGFRLTYPDVFDNIRGLIMPMPVGNTNGMYLLLVSYLAVTKEELEALNQNNEPGQMSEEGRMKIINSTGPLLMIIGADGGQGPEEIIKKLKMENKADTARFVELARHDDITYYSIEDLDGTEKFLAKMDPSFRDEYHALQAGMIEAMKNAEYFTPRIPGAELIGRTVSFETVDIDGNTVNSKDLFASHAVTMINLWATWCGPCKSELAELGNIHRRIAAKDAAIVGICTDADEQADECRKLMAENNMTYINLLPYAELNEQLPTEGIPTSFFVNREGKIMTYPMIGVPADISEYEKTFSEMLAKAAAGYDPSVKENAGEEKKNGCRIIVKDETGGPVEGVTVQFCSDTTCMVGKTDAEGAASFNAEKGHYTVHVQKVPAGYAACTDEFVVPEDLGDVEITVKKSYY